MKKYFNGILLILLFAYSSAFGQSLELNAVDEETNESIPFFTAYYIDYQYGDVADSNGLLVLGSEISLPVKVKIAATGYVSKVITILSSEAKVKVGLEHVHLEIDEISVSTPRNSLNSQNATHVEHKTMDELDEVPATNIGEALQQISGVYAATNGSGVSKPVIRGFQGVRVVTLLNGVRLENQQWGGDHDVGITDLGIGSVEVIKGPASLLYGADAIGGIVYFADEQYAKLNSYKINAITQFESNTMGSKSSLGFKFSRKQIRLNIAGNYTNHADYQLPNGLFVENSRFNGYTAKMALGANKKNWVTHLRYVYSKTFVGIIGGHEEEEQHEEDHGDEFIIDTQPRNISVPYQGYDNQILSWENKFFKGKSRWMIRLGHSYNRLSEFEENNTEAGMRLTLNNSFYSLRYKQNFSSSLELVSGLQGAYQTNQNSGAEENLIPDATQLDNGIYTILYKDWKKWHLQGGLRYDIRLISAPLMNFNEVYSRPSFSAGTVCSGHRSVFKANVSSGFRVPHLSELMADGEHHGAARYEIGNRDLLPEQAFQLDIAEEIKLDHLSVVLNPFFNYVKNYIILNKTDSIIDNLEVYKYEQLSDAFLYGGDIATHYHPHFAHWLHWESSFSFLYAQDKVGDAIPFVPQSRFRNVVRFDLKTKKDIRLMSVIFQHTFFFDQYRVSGLETVSKRYNLINLGLNYHFFNGFPLELGLGVKNLLNETYIDHLSRLKSIGLPNPGRNFYIRLKWGIEGQLNDRN